MVCTFVSMFGLQIDPIVIAMEQLLAAWIEWVLNALEMQIVFILQIEILQHGWIAEPFEEDLRRGGGGEHPSHLIVASREGRTPKRSSQLQVLGQCVHHIVHDIPYKATA